MNINIRHTPAWAVNWWFWHPTLYDHLLLDTHSDVSNTDLLHRDYSSTTQQRIRELEATLSIFMTKILPPTETHMFWWLSIRTTV